MVAQRVGRLVAALAALGLLAAGIGIPQATADDLLVRGSLPMSMGLRFGPDGNLYVCTAAGLAVLDVAQGQMVDMIGPERGVLVPEDVIFGPDGSMYWAAMFVGDLGRRAPDGTVTTQMIGPGVNSLAFDTAGRLFVTEPWITDTLYLVDPTLQQPPQLLAQGLGGLKNMEFGPDGMMYGALMWQGRVVRIDVNTNPVTVETVAEGIPGPFTARFGPDGMLYVVERTGFTVQRMDPATGAHSTYASLPFGPDNIAFAPTGAMFVSSYTDGTVAVALPDGSVQTVVPGGLTVPSGVAVRQRPDGESVFVGNLFALREVDGVTGSELGVERFRFPPVSFGGAVSVAAAGEHLVLTNFFPPGQGRVQVWDPVAGEVVRDVPGISVPVNAIPFGDDLVVVDLGLGEGQARVLRVAAGGTTVLADITDQVVVPLGLVSRDDDLWVGDWYTGMIWQLIANGQELAQPIPAASGLSGPEGMDEATAAGSGDEVRLIQLESSAAARTNIGLVSTSGVTATADVRLFLADGTPAGVLTLELEPFESLQVNDVFGSLGGGQPPVTADDAYAVVTCPTPGAAFFAYASVVDNGTNDPVFVPGR